jgi:hypothetical protein
MATERNGHGVTSERGALHRLAKSKFMRVAPTAIMVGLPFPGAYLGLGASETGLAPWPSDTGIAIGFLAGAAVGIGLAVWLDGWTKRAHDLDTDIVTNWARSQGLHPTTAEPMTLGSRIGPFSYGGYHSVGSAWSGRYGTQQVEIYHYLIGSDRSQKSRKRAYTIVAAEANASPEVVEVLPRSEGRLAAARMNAREMSVESALFNEAWWVRSTDELLARELLTPPVIARLIDAAVARIGVAWDGPAVLCVTPGVLSDTDALAERVVLVADLARMVPGDLRTDGGATAVDPAP